MSISKKIQETPPKIEEIKIRIGTFLLTALDPFEAIRMAVFLHGYTAEITAPLGSRGYIADDFLPMIGKAIRRI